jgi:hypothetical protein
MRLPDLVVTLGLWAAAVLGGGGVIAGLVAVSRGARYPARMLISVAAGAVAALAVLPPAGSTDTLSYATYGRMALLGHNPYVMTPDQLARTGGPIGRLAHLLWQHDPSLYGPLATAEQWAAARLGGTSATAIAGWGPGTSPRGRPLAIPTCRHCSGPSFPASSYAGRLGGAACLIPAGGRDSGTVLSA